MMATPNACRRSTSCFARDSLGASRIRSRGGRHRSPACRASAAEEHKTLQAVPYHAHVDASRRVGVAPWRAPRGLTPVRNESPYYSIGTDGLLAAPAIATLDLIGRRFHAACLAQHLPPARFVVTSTHRSEERQAALREVNANATKGQTSHAFGGSFDIAYNKFLPVASADYAPTFKIDGGIPPRLLAPLQAEVEAKEVAWATTVVSRHAASYDAVLARVLIRLQQEGEVLALREYFQPCFHVTATGGRARA